ncbi:MAG TPA: hypothetical protein VJ770_29460 [Stellaceae bacterium]|nr:hypothetical protein [Stellaceae bacterium]
MEFLEEFHKAGWMCGWRGCTETYEGDQPTGRVNLVIYHAPQPVMDLARIKEWQHNKVFCPTHAAMLSDVLYPTGSDLEETEGSA